MTKQVARSATKSPRRRKAEGRAVCESAGDGPFTAEERATLAFFSVEGIGPVTLAALRTKFGSLAEALRQPAERVAASLRDSSTQKRFVEVKDLPSLADRLFERAERVKAKVLFPSRPGWPSQLEGRPFPPVLYVRGEMDPLARRVAIVGSRDTDAYGEQLAMFFAGALASRGVSVVSGGALGVDGAAHRACLKNHGETVAVLGSGVDVGYPRENIPLFREMIAKGGAVVSHFPPGTPGVPQNFKVRNRLIAALSEAVIVARAGAGSGSLGTAEAARELDRPVFAIPGDVTCPLAAGVNELLESGKARACVGLAPVAAALGLGGTDWPRVVGSKVAVARSKAPPPPLARVSRADIPGELRPVWEALGRDPVQFDELSRRCQLDPSGLAAALVRLELLGLCEERLGKVFVRT